MRAPLSTLCLSGLVALIAGGVSAVRRWARAILSEAREQYGAERRPSHEWGPSVSRLDPLALSRAATVGSTGRLARLLCESRPMGP